MRSNLPPVLPEHPGAPYALEGIPIQLRPAWADMMCQTCSGRGMWNDLFHTDSYRCRRAHCPQCHGAGWLRRDGRREVPIIITRNGLPAWSTITIEPICTAIVESPVIREEREMAEAA